MALLYSIGKIKLAPRGVEKSKLVKPKLSLLDCPSDGSYAEALWVHKQYVQTVLVDCTLGRWEIWTFAWTSSKEALQEA